MNHEAFLPVTQHPSSIKKSFSKVTKDALEQIKNQVAVTTTEESIKETKVPVKKDPEPIPNIKPVVATRSEIKNFIKNL